MTSSFREFYKIFENLFFFLIFELSKATSDLGSFPTRKELPGRRCVAHDPCYGSEAFDCGAVIWFKNVKWDNCARRTVFDWEHEAAIRDIDGTYTDIAPETFVIAKSDAYDPSICKADKSGKHNLNKRARHDAMICTGRFYLGLEL